MRRGPIYHDGQVVCAEWAHHAVGAAALRERGLQQQRVCQEVHVMHLSHVLLQVCHAL